MRDLENEKNMVKNELFIFFNGILYLKFKKIKVARQRKTSEIE